MVETTCSCFKQMLSKLFHNCLQYNNTHCSFAVSCQYLFSLQLLKNPTGFVFASTMSIRNEAKCVNREQNKHLNFQVFILLI